MKHLILILSMFLSILLTGCSMEKGKDSSKDSFNQFWETHTTPEHLSLAVQRDGVIYYLNKQDYNLVRDSIASEFEILGVLVSDKYLNIKFIVALEDEEGGKMIRRKDALERYKDILPRKDESHIMMDKYKALSNAIVAFGGEPLTEQKGVDVWWDKDGRAFGYIDIPWGKVMSSNAEDLVPAAKVRKFITILTHMKNLRKWDYAELTDIITI